jgi:23S rRNA (guanosine2251-2'-O)-methyltransferase
LPRRAIGRRAARSAAPILAAPPPPRPREREAPEIETKRPESLRAPTSTPWIYGRHAVAAALANPARRCRRVVALREAADELRPLLAASRADLPKGVPELLDRSALETLLPPGAVHQGMALAADPLPQRSIADLVANLPEAGAPHIVVALDQVTDPHNVGAILRSAAAFAALAILVPDHGAPSVTGVLAKAASGALETVPLLRVGNLARALGQLKEAGFWCVGLDQEASDNLATLELPDKIVLVLGAEGAGLRRLTRERCDFLARLPTRGNRSSLNVSNAAALALYEVARRGPTRIAGDKG